MMAKEYIERDALKPLEEMEYTYFMSPAAVPYYEADKVWEILDNIPAADVVEVKWIPVTERLPEPFVSVLGYCPDEDPLPAVHECYINGFGQWTSSVVYGMGNVTHWMEMPKPPEDGGAE